MSFKNFTSSSILVSQMTVSASPRCLPKGQTAGNKVLMHNHVAQWCQPTPDYRRRFRLPSRENVTALLKAEDDN